MNRFEQAKFTYNEIVLMLFNESGFRQDYFSKILGISRTRLLNILYNKQNLKINTFLSYIGTLGKTIKLNININIQK